VDFGEVVEEGVLVEEEEQVVVVVEEEEEVAEVEVVEEVEV